MQAAGSLSAAKEACSLFLNLSRFEAEHEKMFPQMTDWWNSLLIEKQIFYAIGLFSLAVLLLQILLTLVGVGHHDADFSGHGDHDWGWGCLPFGPSPRFLSGSDGPG